MSDEFNEKRCYLTEKGINAVKEALGNLNNSNDINEFKEYRKDSTKRLGNFNGFLKKQGKMYFWEEILRYFNFIDKKKDKKESSWTHDTLKKMLQPKHNQYVLRNELEKLFDYLCLELKQDHYKSKPISKKQLSKADKTSNSDVSILSKNTNNQIPHTNETTDQSNQNIEKLLCSLDCKEQKNNFKKKISVHPDKNRRGVFLIDSNSEKNQPWFLWSLGKSIGGFDNAKKIFTQFDITTKKHLNNFWKQFHPHIGAKINDNIDCETVVQGLTDIYKTKSIIIVVRRFKPAHFNYLSNFWSNLFDRIISIPKTEIQRNKLCLVLFLIPEDNELEKYNIENNENQKYPITVLRLTNILKEEVENWLDDNDDELKKSIYDLDKGYEILDDLSSNPYYLIDEISLHVLKKNNGIVGVEHYWNEFA